MAASKVEILIELNDQASKQLGALRGKLDNIGTEGVGATSKSVDDLTKKVDKLGKTQKKQNKETDKTTKSTNKLNSSLAGAAKTAQLIDGPLGGVASRFTAFKSLLLSVNPLIAGTALGFGALFTVMKKAVGAASDLEQAMGKVDAIIKATGGSAGKTIEDINRVAKDIGDATLESATGVREAAAAVLTFKSIRGDEFDRTLKLAADMSSVFGSLESSSLQLAKALENPVQGLTALRRAGVSFSASQKELIKSLVESGEALAAQRIILDAIEGQLGGAGAGSAAGLAGAVDAVSENWTELKANLGDGFVLELASNAVRAFADSIDYLNNFFDGDQTVTRLREIDGEMEALGKNLQDLEAGPLQEAIKLRVNALSAERGALLANKELIAERVEIEETLAEMQERGLVAADGTLNKTAAYAEFINALPLGKQFIAIDIISGDLNVGGLTERLAEINAEIGDTVENTAAAAQEAKDALLEARQEADAKVQRDDSDKKGHDERVANQEELNKIRDRGTSDSIKFEIEQLNFAYAQKTISAEDYYDQLKVLSQRQASIEVSGLDRQIAAQSEMLRRRAVEVEGYRQAAIDATGSTSITQDGDAQYTKIKVQLDKLTAQRVNAAERVGQVETRVSQQQITDLEKFEDKLEEISEKNTGFEVINTETLDDDLAFARAKVAAGFADMREDLVQAFGEGSEQVTGLDKLVDVNAAQAQFDALNDLIDTELSQLADKTAEIDNAISLGQTTQTDGDNQLVETYAAATVEVDKLKTALEELAYSEGNEVLIDQLDEINVKASDLAVSAEAVGEQWQTNLEKAGGAALDSGMQDFFGDVIDGTESVTDAFKGMATGILEAMKKVLLSTITKKLIQMLGDTFGGGSGTAANVVAGALTAATGGYIRGPGSGTSDSIPARLSDGEYVIKAAAVQKYGVGLFEMLNRMMVDGNSLGGGSTLRRVPITRPKVKRFADGGYVSADDGQDKSGGPHGDVSLDLSVINVSSEDEARKYLSGRGGESEVLKILTNNQSRVAGILRRN